MTPLKQAKYKSAEIWVDGNGMPIQSLIKEKNDDTSTVLLTNLQKNVRINSADFKMSLDGLRIIKS
jgi:outer membrane lipoprotein-sorting protein